MKTSLYSVRMRASIGGQHLTGAERIVAEGAVAETTTALTKRAMNSAVGSPDDICCSVDKIDSATILYAKLPDVKTFLVDNFQQGQLAALSLLSRAGIQKNVAAKAIDLLAAGPGPDGTVMRGAVLIDAATGQRLEKNPNRGVRVSRMDLSSDFRSKLEATLKTAGLNHYRVLEALVLAGKVLSCPGVVAELCWSDAPDYTTGYVADLQYGYQRISNLKMAGDPCGGRIFFVDLTTASLQSLIDYLELKPVLFNAVGTISAPQKWITNDE